MSRTVEAILSANVSAYVSAMKQAETATGKLETAATKVGTSTQVGLDTAAKSTKGLSAGFTDLSKTVGISVGKSVEAGSKLNAVGVDFKNRFTDLSQSVEIAVGQAVAAGSKLSGVGAEFQKLQKIALDNEQAWNKVANTAGAVGLAASAAVGLAVKEFASFDAAMSGVASTGADAKSQIDQLRQAAITAGADTAFSAVEAANGIEELARAGVSTADVLGGGLDGSLALAAAGQISVADSAAIASTAMTQFKLRGKDVGHIADLLAAGAGKAMGGVDDLGMALKQGGLVASQFGLSIEETVGGLSAFAAQGLLGSDAGTSLKTMLLKLASPSKEAARLMDDLGISAYDAQGEFVGLESLAGQLQGRLGDLEPATRDAAMATIFGTDAIRAANVLYDEGAEGIANWTAAVDDAGYAAETAAELQNNLMGDLEKLGGSWSTLAITMGEAADGPLRAVVQALTGLVDLMGQSPAAAQSVLIATAAIGGLSLAAAGLMKGVTFVADFKNALNTLTEAYPKLEKVSGALGKVGKAAGLAAAGFVALSVIGDISENLWGVAPAADAAAAALERMNKGAGLESLDSMFKTADGKDVAQYVGDLKSALDVLATVELGGGLAWQSNDFFSHLFGATSQLDRIKAQFKGLDGAITSLPMAQAAQIFSGIRDSAFEAGLPMDELVQRFPDYAAQVQMLAAANGLGELSNEQLAMAMAGLYGPLSEVQTGMSDTTTAAAAQAGAYDAAAAAAEADAKAQAELSEAARDALDAHLGLIDAINGLNDAQTDAASTVMSAERANAKWIESLQEAKEQIKENGTSLDENSEKGRNNAEYLRKLAEAARANTDAMHANGDSVDEVNGKMVQQRAEFIQTIAKFGVTGQAAEDLADRYGLIPNYVETVVAMPGAKLSQAEADELNRLLRDIPEELRPEIITIGHTEGAGAAKAAIDAVKSKTVTLTVNQVIKIGSYTGYTGRYPGAMQEADGGVVDYYAAGGLRENHVAQFAPAGAWRVWAEHETGGEAYIPLAASKRARSTAIWWETGVRLGTVPRSQQLRAQMFASEVTRTDRPQHFANGGFAGRAPEFTWMRAGATTGPAVTNITNTIHAEVQLPPWMRRGDQVFQFLEEWALHVHHA